MSLRVVPAYPLSRKVRAAASRIRCRVRSDFGPASAPFAGAGPAAGRAARSGGAGKRVPGAAGGWSALMAPAYGRAGTDIEKF